MGFVTKEWRAEVACGRPGCPWILTVKADEHHQGMQIVMEELRRHGEDAHSDGVEEGCTNG